MISSEAVRAAGCRGPWDVVNLAAVWGLSQEKGKEAVSTLPRNLVANAALKRTGFRGVVDVVYGGEKSSAPVQSKGNGQAGSKKRTNGEMDVDDSPHVEKFMSNREKRRACPQGQVGSAEARHRARKHEYVAVHFT